MTSPTLTYDREANALYIRFSRNPIAETVALSDAVYVDVDGDGEPVGFEVLHTTSADLAGIPALPASAAFRDLLKPHTLQDNGTPAPWREPGAGTASD